MFYYKSFAIDICLCFLMLNSYLLLYESNCREIIMVGYLLHACAMVKISYPMDVYLLSY